MYFETNGDLVGILNDYDLASVMEPGTCIPEIDGYERAGTKPFMSLDLLRNQSDPFRRRYRHDLESFAWRFLWEMQSKTPRWTAETSEAEYARKAAYAAEIYGQVGDVKIEWLPSFLFIAAWFEGFLCFSKTMSQHMADTYGSGRELITKEERLAMRWKLEENMSDREHLRPVIEAARAVRCAEDLEVIRDTSWLDLEVLK